MRDQKTFGDILKDLRNKLGKTQDEVADEISLKNPDAPMTQARLSYIENRETAPRQDVLEIFARYYDVPLSYFFETQSKEVDVNRKMQIKSYLESLKNRTYSEQTIRTHTDDNSANDNEVIDSLDTVRRWQSSYNENPEE